MLEKKIKSETITEIEEALKKMNEGDIKDNVIPLDACGCTGNMWDTMMIR